MGFPPRLFLLTVTHNPMFLHILHRLRHPMIDGVPHHFPSDPLLQSPLDSPQITQNRTFGSSPF